MNSNILLASVYTLEEDPWERKQMKPYPPLGILYIASYLKKHGFENDNFMMFDATFNPGFKKYSDCLDTFKPDIIGITTNTITENKAIDMIKITKEKHDIPVIIGGPGPSMNPKNYLNGNADCVVLGEGEETAIEVFRHFTNKDDLAIEEIKGIAFKKNNRTVNTPSRGLIKDLDTIPYPYRDLIDVEDYRQVWKKRHGTFFSSIITARGCPYSCTWCARDLSFGRKYRYRSIEDVIGEIRELKDKYQVEALRFVDDILTVHKKRSIELFTAMIEEDVRIPFECLTRVDRVDEELLTLMKKAGLQLIYYGVESGSQRILNSMNKQIKVSDSYEASRLMKKLNLLQSWFLMLGYPPENLKDIKKTLKMVRELNPDKFGVSIAYPLPKTKFFQDLVESGNLLINENQWNQSLDNKLLFKSNYSSEFYKWTIRGLYLNYYTSKIHKKNNNLITKVMDTGAYLCTNKVLEFLSKFSNSRNSSTKDKNGKNLEDLPVEPIPVQC
jgi:radical SAM superfamily enzyme YgiQ (UPF0313 family)